MLTGMMSSHEAVQAVTPTESHQKPLVLDVDGTLLRVDMLHETAIAFLRTAPWAIFLLAWWLIQGKAFLKRKLAERVPLDIANLPINEELVAYASAAHKAGRVVYIATAADQLLAIKLGQRFDFVSFVIASDGKVNLKGAAKAAALKQRFPNGFVYAGDSAADIDVWRDADGIILVNAKQAVARKARALCKPVEMEFKQPALGVRGWAKALRLHQWAKNLLIFPPLILGGLASEPAAWFVATLAFVALGLVASATYLVNDLWDIQDDRRHWTKRNRALASGRMTVGDAAAVVLVTLGVGLAIGSLAGIKTVVVLLAYLALTLGYSLAFKRKPILDAFTLGVLFTLRLVLGIVAVGVTASPWLLVFSMFLFTSLSFAKRQTEVLRLAEKNEGAKAKLSGRGYLVTDAPFILAMGVSSGMASTLIMVLYLTQDAMMVNFYGNSAWLWGIPPMLFLWLSRIWMLSQRGELDDDPVVFAMRDPKSLMLCAGVGVFYVLAWLGIPY